MQMPAALDDILIADLSHVFAGPFCTMALADMGANVIKIEPPQGDATRSYMPSDLHGESPSFLSMNRNKKGIVLDLWNERGREVVLDIVSRADVVVENFSTGVMKRFGLDYEALAEANPRLIYCSISAYGRSGPYAGRAGYDPVIQAETGLMSLNGESDGAPYRTGVAFVDLCTGMFATQAILAALYSRTVTGRGQFIDVPLFDTAMSLAGYHTMSFLSTGSHPGRQGNSSILVAPVGLYDTLDGQFFITVAGDNVWKKMLKALGEPQELCNPSYASNTLRVQAMVQLNIDLQLIFSKNTRAHWIDRLREAGVPAGPLLSIAQAADSPEARSRQMIREATHTKIGTVPDIRLPMQMMGTPLIAPRGAPVLGADTHSVLSEFLGYSEEFILSLEAAGVLGNTCAPT